MPYPFPKLKGVPIFNSINQELVYIYLPKLYFDISISKMKLKESHFYDSDNIIELNKLVCHFLDDSFRNSPLTERLTISYKKNMEKIKPSYSFILYPDEHFLNMKEVREILGNFRDLKKQIMINQNDNEKNSFNPFFKEDSEDEDEEEEEEEEGEKYDNEDGVEN